MQIRLEFKPADLWIGLYFKRGEAWNGDPHMGGKPLVITDVWVCLLPMLPIHFTHWRAKTLTEVAHDRAVMFGLDKK
jgi:hypothetical protein